ncbi:MAG: DMT family transporter [Pseudomonadota bacterium]|nr:DMT family transporter [Pseudomonadota bacterium]
MTEGTRPVASPSHRRGLALTSVGALLFTLDVPLLRLAAGDRWSMVAARGALLALAIFIWWFVFHYLRGRREPFINGGAGAVVAVTNTLANIMFIAAVTMTTAANIVFILALNPIFCAIFAWIVLKETMHPVVGASIALAMLGVLIIVWDGLATGTYIGDLLAVGVAVCTAIALTAVRYSGKNVIPSLAVGSFASAVIAYMFLAADPGGLSSDSWGWLALNGLIIMPLASGLIALGPLYIPAAEVALLFLLDTVFTPVWIWLIFGELPTRNALIGGVIIFVTLALLAIWRITTSRQRDHAVQQV